MKTTLIRVRILFVTLLGFLSGTPSSRSAEPTADSLTNGVSYYGASTNLNQGTNSIDGTTAGLANVGWAMDMSSALGSWNGSGTGEGGGASAGSSSGSSGGGSFAPLSFSFPSFSSEGSENASTSADVPFGFSPGTGIILTSALLGLTQIGRIIRAKTAAEAPTEAPNPDHETRV